MRRELWLRHTDAGTTDAASESAEDVFVVLSAGSVHPVSGVYSDAGVCDDEVHIWNVDELGSVQRDVWRRRADTDTHGVRDVMWAGASQSAVQHTGVRVASQLIGVSRRSLIAGTGSASASLPVTRSLAIIE